MKSFSLKEMTKFWHFPGCGTAGLKKICALEKQLSKVGMGAMLPLPAPLNELSLSVL
jgi:hypothetical protein